jgi:CheY-like chemotaxis protein
VSGRVLFCPTCNARYDVARELIPDAGVVLLCGACGSAAKLGAFTDAAPASAGPASAAENGPLADAQRPRVVVGHEVPAAARSIATVLRQGSYAPVIVKSGEQVLAACDPSMPAPVAAVILDVGIPGVLAFEVIEQLRAHPATKKLPVVLLASVFERTRYKRRATNLYGADAYLELHHVPDRLVQIVDSLRNAQPVGEDRLQSPVERARAASLRSHAVSDDQDGAHALARRLLSDVVLYHGDEVADGVRRGQPFSSLASAIDAARDLFKEQFPGSTVRAEVFEQELAALAARLLDRDAPRRSGADA